MAKSCEAGMVRVATTGVQIKAQEEGANVISTTLGTALS